MFKLELDLSNDAFAVDLQLEVARILEAVAQEVRDGNTTGGRVRDSNGNDAGRFRFILGGR